MEIYFERQYSSREQPLLPKVRFPKDQSHRGAQTRSVHDLAYKRSGSSLLVSMIFLMSRTSTKKNHIYLGTSKAGLAGQRLFLGADFAGDFWGNGGGSGRMAADVSASTIKVEARGSEPVKFVSMSLRASSVALAKADPALAGGRRSQMSARAMVNSLKVSEAAGTVPRQLRSMSRIVRVPARPKTSLGPASLRRAVATVPKCVRASGNLATERSRLSISLWQIPVASLRGRSCSFCMAVPSWGWLVV
jgi:hypothetical protein